MVLSALSKQTWSLEIGHEPHHYQEVLNWWGKDLCKWTNHFVAFRTFSERFHRGCSPLRNKTLMLTVSELSFTIYTHCASEFLFSFIHTITLRKARWCMRGPGTEVTWGNKRLKSVSHTLRQWFQAMMILPFLSPSPQPAEHVWRGPQPFWIRTPGGREFYWHLVGRCEGRC